MKTKIFNVLLGILALLVGTTMVLRNSFDYDLTVGGLYLIAGMIGLYEVFTKK